MKKLVSAMLVLALAASLCFAGGSKDSGGSSSSAPSKMVLRWGIVHAPTSPMAQLMYRIIDGVNSRTEGRIEIQGFPAGQLGGSRDLVEGIQTGIIDMTAEGPAQFSASVPLSTIAEAPYIWRDREHMVKAVNGEFGKQLNAEFEKANVHILGMFYYGTRQLTTSNKAIYSVADMQGMKIRVPEVDTYVTMIESWGARPTPMTLNELYLALQQNVADGQENPLTTFDGQKFYEVQKYVILTDHIICPNEILINKQVWDKISAKDQQIFNEVVAEAIAWNNAEVVKQEEALLDEFRAKGVTVIRPDVESFRAATVKALVPKFEGRWGKGTWESIQAIK